MSQHLRILKDTGLVSERRAGTRRYYRARTEGLAELRAFLEVLLGEESWMSAGPGALLPSAAPAPASSNSNNSTPRQAVSHIN